MSRTHYKGNEVKRKMKYPSNKCCWGLNPAVSYSGLWSITVPVRRWRSTNFMCVCVCVCVCLAVYYKTQRISNREFKLWTILQGTESRVVTFHAEACVMSHQSLSRQAKTKSESPTAVEFGSRTPKSDHGSSENV